MLGSLTAGVVIIAGSTLALSPPAGAATITVTTTADGVAGSLRAAITTASGAPSPTTIVLAPGRTYDLTICAGDDGQEDANASGDLDYTGSQPLTISGDGGTIRQTCAPEDHERVLEDTAARGLTLDGTTITGGNAGPREGGGIRSTGDVTMTNCMITGNHTDASGGGLLAKSTSLTSTLVIRQHGRRVRWRRRHHLRFAQRRHDHGQQHHQRGRRWGVHRR